MKLEYSELSLLMRSDSKTELNYWAGSSLRGALNKEIKAEYCVSKTGDCMGCQNEMCPNKILFCESTVTDKSLTTNPVIIKCDKQTAPTDMVHAKIVLIGTGRLAADSLVETLERGIALGISRERFCLSKCSLETYCIDTSKIESCSKLKLSLRSPLIRKGSRGLDFGSIMQAVTVRVGAIANTIGVAKDMDYIGLRERARHIGTEETMVKTEQVHRSSSRVNKNYEMAGLIGHCIYKGDMSEYIPYLRAAEVFSLGKYCSMGFGQTKIDILGV